MPRWQQALQVEVLAVRRRRLQQHLELVVVLQPVGVLAVAAVGRPARRLHVGAAPGLGPERAQGRRRMEGAGADLHVVGLQDDAAALRPERLQRQNEGLEGGAVAGHAWTIIDLRCGHSPLSSAARTILPAPGPVKATPCARGPIGTGQRRSSAGWCGECATFPQPRPTGHLELRRRRPQLSIRKCRHRRADPMRVAKNQDLEPDRRMP